MKSLSGKEFMRKTWYESIEQSDQQKGLPQPPLELPVETDIAAIELPDPHGFSPVNDSLTHAISQRTSVRSYTDDPLSLDELSFLLWMSQGVKKVMAGKATFRTVPSAGARHAFETYLLVNTVTTLNPGLYRYCASKHMLYQLAAPDSISADITAACWNQDFVAKSAVTFIWSAVPYRMTWRYSDRGYRYLHLDAGHVCQNLYLAAESINCGVCAIAAFHDQTMNALLHLDGDTQFVIYCAAAGRKN